MKKHNITKGQEERFWEKVDVGGEDDCWNWTAGKFNDGYGCFKVSGRSMGAHRFSYVMVHGEIPRNMFVHHTCKNRSCVNPDHLLAEASTERGRMPERFWEKVDIRGPDECWEWGGNKSRTGYGMLRNSCKKQSAHRVSWEIHNGQIPTGMCVCHSCDVPGCVNPNHLFLGTQQDNMDDMVAKNRQSKRKGEESGHSKLKSKDVIAIRHLAEHLLQIEIGEMFGITQGHVTSIVNRKSWSHI